jgi:glycosyltransferase involved in cell wall biosynthesis
MDNKVKVKGGNIKVLHIIDNLGNGGAQTIVKTLIENDENSYAYVLREDSIRRDLDVDSSKRVFIYPSRFRYMVNLKMIFHLKNFIKNNEFDVINVHLIKSIFVLYILSAMMKFKAKVFVFEHGEIFRNNRWYNLLFRKLEKKGFRFVAVSDSTKKLIVKYAGIDSGNIGVVYNFSFASVFDKKDNFDKFAFRKKFGFAKDDFVLGYIGRLSYDKHIEHAIEALRHLDSRIKLVIVGTGDKEDELKSLAEKLGLVKRVVFTGFRNDVNNFYRIFDVCVLCSESEASPMMFYEGQEFGVPLVGSRVCAIDEFVKDYKNGLLFEFGNIEDLAAKIRILFDDRKLVSDMGRYAKENMKNYTFKKYVRNLQDVYKL